MKKRVGIRPQKGYQTKFVCSKADIVIGGGSAGVGKTYGFFLDYSKYIPFKKYGGVIFRRLTPQITNEGGLWDTSEALFNEFESPPRPSKGKLTWRFASGNKLKFSHLQYEKNKLHWQGSQISYLGFDELTHFTKSQFFYMLTRNRSTSSYKPVCRATTNPQGHGWVKDFISWWLYPDDYPIQALAGFPIPERAGVVRYFTRHRGDYVWGNSPIEVLENLPSDIAAKYSIHDIKSITFIPGQLDENEILLNLDPSYRGNLLAQDQETMERLLLGRWIRFEDGRLKLFKWNALRDCFSNSFIPHGKAYMTCDIALEGSDLFVVGIWSGFRLEHIYTYEKSDGSDILKTIRELSKKHKVPASHICIDADGVGGAFKGFLKTSYAFHNGSSPIMVDKRKQNYKNLKAQCFYMLKEYINDYKMYFNVTEEIDIDMIMEELYSIERKETNLETIQIIAKDELRKKIGRSTDLADMIMMRMVFLLPKVVKKGNRSVASL